MRQWRGLRFESRHLGREETALSKSNYFAFRTGPGTKDSTYPAFNRQMVQVFRRYEREGWYQDSLGKDCVDDEDSVSVYGKVRLLIGEDLWPFSDRLNRAQEKWLFTAIEFTYDHVAEPTETIIHNWNGCGLHVISADSRSGQEKFLAEVNGLFMKHYPSYYLDEDGLIYRRGTKGLEINFPPITGESRLDSRIASAVRTFQQYGTTLDGKRHAIKDLADVLEHLRESVGTGLPNKDEDDLFRIANQFGIRHYNQKQRLDYDGEPWLDWMFRSFLNTIHLICHLRTNPVS